MRPVSILAATAVAGALAGCAADPYYARSSYGPGYYAPGYTYTSPPRYYRPTTYNYSSPQYSSQRRSYDGYWDYMRNYRGVHASPEFSSM